MAPPVRPSSQNPIFNEYLSSPGLLHSGEILLAQVNPQPQQGRAGQVTTDAPQGVQLPAAPVNPIFSDLGQQIQARSERERLLSDAAIWGDLQASPERQTTYLSVTLTVYRVRQFLNGSQPDTNSILMHLQNWQQQIQDSNNPVFNQLFENLRNALNRLQHPINQERLTNMRQQLRAVQQGSIQTPQVQGPVGQPQVVQPQTVQPQSNVPPVVQPNTGQPAVVSPQPRIISGQIVQGPVIQVDGNPSTIRPGHVLPQPEIVPAPRVSLRPVTFVSQARSVGEREIMNDMRSNVTPAIRSVVERHSRNGGPSSVRLTLHIQYNGEGNGTVMSRGHDRYPVPLVQDILNAVAQHLPRFRGNAGSVVE
ncbi:MAG: hypothetical protein JNK65_02080, partial [Deltaproteobacteria bacterium]|nr:hypothetical protein [Deltaproteobacteria bacterium]